MNNKLMIAGLLARAKMQKQASVAGGAATAGKGILSLLRGVAQTGGAGFRAAGQTASQLTGGGAVGKGLEYGIRATPYVGGAYLLNQAAGHPTEQFLQRKYYEHKARMAANQGVWDPNAGVMY